MEIDKLVQLLESPVFMGKLTRAYIFKLCYQIRKIWRNNCIALVKVPEQ